MTKREDLRVTKTKKKLFDTFIKMLEIMDFDSITINELCSFSGVRRATFYKHFNDKMNFFVFVTEELRHNFNENVWDKDLIDPGVEYYVEYAKKIIDFLDVYEKITENIIESSIFMTLLQIIIEQNSKDTFLFLEKSEKLGRKLPASANVTSVMLVGAVATAILGWLKEKKSMPKELFAQEVSSIIEKILGN